MQDKSSPPSSARPPVHSRSMHRWPPCMNLKQPPSHPQRVFSEFLEGLDTLTCRYVKLASALLCWNETQDDMEGSWSRHTTTRSQFQHIILLSRYSLSPSLPTRTHSRLLNIRHSGCGRPSSHPPYPPIAKRTPAFQCQRLAFSLQDLQAYLHQPNALQISSPPLSSHSPRLDARAKPLLPPFRACIPQPIDMPQTCSRLFATKSSALYRTVDGIEVCFPPDLPSSTALTSHLQTSSSPSSLHQSRSLADPSTPRVRPHQGPPHPGPFQSD
ncbi:hypothetical protein R3P38DRAFT_932077 [Favolaschia claudopus]|uniref:Uncharacterized protein n=1 Tax=Favolaschia claudopus TaxID=2862362 RepID=A0AAW0BN06_9AGAR